MVFDGTGVWIFRKLTPEDYFAFPEIEKFHKQLDLDKVSIYGKSFSDQSIVRKFLL